MDFGFRILDFGGSGGCTTRQFSDGALGSEARIPPGPSLGGGAEPTVSDTVGEREGTWWWKQQEKQVKPIFFHVFRDFTCSFGLFMSGGPSLAASLRVTKTNCIWYSWGKKENWATETREGGRENGGQPFPQLYQIRLVLVTFRRLQCVFLGLLAPSPGNLPGSAATGASLF